jgi:hypothetical protein
MAWRSANHHHRDPGAEQSIDDRAITALDRGLGLALPTVGASRVTARSRKTHAAHHT